MPCRPLPGQRQARPNPLPHPAERHRLRAMMRYFNIHDRARLPGRFYGESLSVTARL